MVLPAEAGGGGGGTPTVTVNYTQLSKAIAKVREVSSDIETQRNSVLMQSPVSHPSLGASQLGTVSTWLDDQLPMLNGLHDIAYLLATEGTTATFQVGSSAADIKDLLGRTLADRARETTPYDEAGAKPFAEILAKWTSDPAVMAEFQLELGPEDSLRLLSAWAQPLEHPAHSDPTDQQRQILNLLKQSLQTATQEGGFTSLEATNFAEGLVAAATIPPEDYWGRGPYNPSGALAFLLHDGHYGDKFIGTVADGLDQYERQDNNGAGPELWTMRPEQSVSFHDYLPFGAYNVYDGNIDVMAAAMTALGNSPKASLEFFSDNDDDGVAGGQPSRAYYYIHDRDWQSDSFNGISAALRAATTDSTLLEHGTDAQRKDAALLASKTVEYFSDRDDLEDVAEALHRWPENKAAEDLAHILSTYMPGVERGIDNTADIDPAAGPVKFDSFDNYIENVPIFDRDGLKQFMLLSTATDEGLAELNNGMNHWRASNLGALADGMHDGDDGSALRAGIQNDARLQGFLIKVMGEDEVHEAHQQDARIKGTIDMFSDVVDLIPAPGASRLAEGITKEAITYLYDEGKGAGFDALKDHFANNEERTVGEYDDRAEALLQRQKYAVAELLASHGLLGDEAQLSDVTRPDGQVLTYREYMELNDADKELVESELFSSDSGVGQYLSEQDYREAFKEIFADSYFEPEGD